MEQIILFVITFLIVYVIYYFVTIRKELKKEKRKSHPEKNQKSKRKKNKIDHEAIPVEVEYLRLRYQIDFKEISYRKLLYTIAFVSALDMSIVVTLISFIPGFIWQMLVGFVLLLPMIAISFHFIGKYYQKKGKKSL